MDVSANVEATVESLVVEFSVEGFTHLNNFPRGWSTFRCIIVCEMQSALSGASGVCRPASKLAVFESLSLHQLSVVRSCFARSTKNEAQPQHAEAEFVLCEVTEENVSFFVPLLSLLQPQGCCPQLIRVAVLTLINRRNLAVAASSSTFMHNQLKQTLGFQRTFEPT